MCKHNKLHSQCILYTPLSCSGSQGTGVYPRAEAWRRSHSHSHLWAACLGRKPTETHGEHANSTQKGRLQTQTELKNADTFHQNSVHTRANLGAYSEMSLPSVPDKVKWRKRHARQAEVRGVSNFFHSRGCEAVGRVHTTARPKCQRRHCFQLRRGTSGGRWRRRREEHRGGEMFWNSWMWQTKHRVYTGSRNGWCPSKQYSSVHSGAMTALHLIITYSSTHRSQN